jgi:hypothetical protein
MSNYPGHPNVKKEEGFDQFFNIPSASNSQVSTPVSAVSGFPNLLQHTGLPNGAHGYALLHQMPYDQMNVNMAPHSVLRVKSQYSEQLQSPPVMQQYQDPRMMRTEAELPPGNADVFLDGLDAINSPSNTLYFNQQFASTGMSNDTPSTGTPPVIISTPPTDVIYQNNLNLTNESTAGAGFLQPSLQGSQFQQLRSMENPLSDLSSVENSPYLSPYSGSHLGDDDLSSNGFLQEFNSNSGNEMDMLSIQLNGLTQEDLQTAQSPVTISIDAAPEDIGHRTPSLFSSNSSTRNNSPAHSRVNSSHSNTMKAGHFASLLAPNADGVSSGSAVEDDELLKPDPHAEMRAGRQNRQSRSRSGSSASRSLSRKRSVSSNREKMLELASPISSDKRTQKNPSIYACHLCEKRFTRPYNLKSHLRTHTDERPFVCTVCGRAFARQHDRKRHEELHSGKKKYECYGVLRDGVTPWGCGKKFARTDALGRHFKTDAGKECIRPLVEEHEFEVKQTNGGLSVPNLSGLPDELFTQFPGLLSSGSGVSDVDE